MKVKNDFTLLNIFNILQQENKSFIGVKMTGPNKSEQPSSYLAVTLDGHVLPDLNSYEVLVEQENLPIGPYGRNISVATLVQRRKRKHQRYINAVLGLALS